MQRQSSSPKAIAQRSPASRGFFLPSALLARTTCCQASRCQHPGVGHTFSMSIAAAKNRQKRIASLESSELSSEFLSLSLRQSMSVTTSVQKTLWHYAPGVYVPKISEHGELKPSNAGAPHEQPILWFSENQGWEPTAGKLLLNKFGQPVRTMGFAEQVERLGCVRYGIDSNDRRLFHWKEACKLAEMSRDDRRKLERAGKSIGANPEHWWGTQFSIDLEELCFEYWNGKGWT